ncbi:hypothetical protein WJX84_010098 [Apatococcus fuscideae]|uniref:Uncharacterized protein n=1 Tax=Apatococcus fuscideae TaxID=2026836 RepID=A0AAW1SM59_9CHLO
MPLGKRTDCGDARYAGCVVAFSNNPSQHLQAALQSGFDFITAPLADPAYRRPAANSAVKGAQQPDFSVQNLLLISSKCSSQSGEVKNTQKQAANQSEGGDFAATPGGLGWGSGH